MLRMVQINNLYDFASRRRKLVIRFSLLCLVAFFISQVFPTNADEQVQQVEMQSEVAEPISDSATVTQEPAPQPSESATATSGPSEEPKPTPTPSYKPAVATPGQGMQIAIPYSVSVDPRAQVSRLPRINVTGPTFLLACLNSNNLVMDVVSKGMPDDQPAQNLFLSGDLSTSVVIAGQTEFVVSALNSAGGIRVSGLGRKLAGTSLQISLISTDKMATSGALCGEAYPTNNRTVRLTGIGLGVELKKGEVKLD
jgi:hypothetical protein